MNPLEPNDPLWKLLGKAREVEIRGNFAQDVVRAARHEPQERGLWAWLRAPFAGGSSPAWLRPSLLAGAAALVVCGLVLRTPSATETSVTVAPAPDLSDDVAMIQLAEAMPTTPLDSVNEMDALLALDDASAMTDRELVSLFY